jgi:hypothetical protein
LVTNGIKHQRIPFSVFTNKENNSKNFPRHNLRHGAN